MTVVPPSDVIEELKYLHVKLDAHFRLLHQLRLKLEPASPVFALEHDLSETEIEMLKSAVRSGIRDYLLSHFRQTWLPFVVYAAEMGYGYEGDEYWTTFSSQTPRWTYQERSTIGEWFRMFASTYGGAEPKGAWARQFRIISWPITHAVLPVYLQIQFARLLFEFRTGLTSDVLRDPDALGARLASRAGMYSDRFRQFAQNTVLVGQVAVALLAGSDDESLYLTKPTLNRMVQGLSEQHQARQWLDSARREASRVRAAGFRSSRSGSGEQGGKHRLPRASDPNLFLRLLDGVWNAYAEFPDLTPISERLPEVFEEMRILRARVQGANRPIASGGLTDAGQEIHFQAWPDPAKPFVQLENGSEHVNGLIADQCVMTSGPWWLFRLQAHEAAFEVKGRFIRPAHQYILIGKTDQQPPPLQWCYAVELNVSGAKAFRLEAPEQLTDSETAVLVDHGLSTVSSVAILPVGIVASSWDGEGSAEWLAGEPAIIGIRSELQPESCLITLDGDFYRSIPYPKEGMGLTLSFTGLGVGRHEVGASLLTASDQELAAGSLLITVRDPFVRPENASVGEGIRMLASPARPTMVELWDEKVSITIDGPAEVETELVVSLQDEWGNEIAKLNRKQRLPVDAGAWRQIAQSFRREKKFKGAYDKAEKCVVTVHRDSVGMASLTSERGFQPLRWRFDTARDGSHIATLTDRSDGGTTRVEIYTVDEPLKPVERNPTEPIPLPSSGGLLRAIADEVDAIVLAPTNPKDFMEWGKINPKVPFGDKSLAEVMRLVEGHHLWAVADLPADPFAVNHRQKAMDAISRAISLLLSGSHWSTIERNPVNAKDPADLLDAMRKLVGNTPSHQALADAISHNLDHWLKPEDILPGFSEVIYSTLVENGIDVVKHPTTARFLLTLAGRSGWVMDWPKAEREYLLHCVVNSPVLLRAARFAVLGANILHGVESIERSF